MKIPRFRLACHTIEGHDMAAILDALTEAKTVTGKPVMIIANPKKGKGVVLHGRCTGWHGVAPNCEQAAAALAELE